MEIKQAEQSWREISEEVITGMREWREQNPQATMKEIESTLDEKLARLRARMLQDTLRSNTRPTICSPMSRSSNMLSRPQPMPPICSSQTGLA